MFSKAKALKLTTLYIRGSGHNLNRVCLFVFDRDSSGGLPFTATTDNFYRLRLARRKKAYTAVLNNEFATADLKQLIGIF